MKDLEDENKRLREKMKLMEYDMKHSTRNAMGVAEANKVLLMAFNSSLELNAPMVIHEVLKDAMDRVRQITEMHEDLNEKWKQTYYKMEVNMQRELMELLMDNFDAAMVGLMTCSTSMYMVKNALSKGDSEVALGLCDEMIKIVKGVAKRGMSQPMGD